MPTLGITWADKITGGQPKTTREQQWWFEDANEVKNAINAHKDLLDQFTFSDPLDGKVGLGITPTAKLHAKASVGGEPLLKLETFGGSTAIQVDDDGNTIIKGATGSLSPLIVDQLTPFGSPFDQNILTLRNAGTDRIRVRADGNIDVLNSQAVMLTGYYRTATGGSNNLIPFGSNTGGIKTGIYFPSFSTMSFTINGKELTRQDANSAFGIGTSETSALSGTSVSFIEPTAIFHVDAIRDRFESATELRGSITFPRMTQTERLAITAPATGLHVYQTDGTEGVYVNKSTGWVLAY